MRILILIFFFAGLPAPMPAQDLGAIEEVEVTADSDLVRDAVARGDVLSLAVLLPLLAAEHPGEVLDIEIDLNPDGSIEEYEFDVLTPEGRLIEVDMDALTGEITKVEDEYPDDDEDN